MWECPLLAFVKRADAVVVWNSSLTNSSSTQSRKPKNCKLPGLLGLASLSALSSSQCKVKRQGSSTYSTACRVWRQPRQKLSSSYPSTTVKSDIKRGRNKDGFSEMSRRQDAIG